MWRLGWLSLLLLTAAAVAGCDGSPNGDVTAGQGDAQTVNGSVHVPAGQHSGAVGTVNGSVEIGQNASVSSARVVNGPVELGTNATAGSLTAVNGAIELGSGAKVTGQVKSVNGAVTLASGADVSGSVVNVNGHIALTDAHVGGKSMPSSRFNGTGSIEPLVVTPEANSVSVEFAALDYSAPERNHYAYRLDGYDRDWVETDAAHRLAAYTNLPPGDYQLRLRGSNRDGVWTETTPTLAIRVLPAWYQRLWFRLVIGCVALLLVAAVVQARTRYLRKRHRELERQVADRTAELRASQHQLEQIAYSDTLTALPNRRMFTEDFRKLAAQARRQGGGFALLLIDLDGFKEVNDTLGHDAGDALLIEVAGRLLAAVRETDRVARLGGDEFAILLPASQARSDIDMVCQRIVEDTAAPVVVNGATIRVSASIGVALFPEHGETQGTLNKSADLALYDAKRSGRNTWRWYDETMIKDAAMTK